MKEEDYAIQAYIAQILQAANGETGEEIEFSVRNLLIEFGQKVYQNARRDAANDVAAMFGYSRVNPSQT
jgi:hypothetical protein